jgi:hypothetical protein
MTTNISFNCQSCEGDFEVNVTHLLERPNALKCPHCGARPPAHRCHALSQSLDDLLSAMAGIKSKVHFELTLDTNALPPPYGGKDAGSVLAGDEDEDDVGGDDVDDDDDEKDDDKDADDDDEEDDDDDDDDDEDDDEEDSDEEDEDFEFDEDAEVEDDDEEEEEEEEEAPRKRK